MKEIEGSKFYTVSKVCERVVHSAQTIRIWFKAKSLDAEGLTQQKLQLQSYNQGINEMKSHQFDNAIMSFNKVINIDKESFANVQNKLVECKKEMIKKYSNK